MNFHFLLATVCWCLLGKKREEEKKMVTDCTPQNRMVKNNHFLCVEVIIEVFSLLRVLSFIFLPCTLVGVEKVQLEIWIVTQWIMTVVLVLRHFPCYVFIPFGNSLKCFNFTHNILWCLLVLLFCSMILCCG